MASYAKFRRVLDDVKPDLVQAGPVQTGGFLAALSAFHPLLLMSWGSDILSVSKTSRWMRSVTKFTLKRADMVLADCEAVRNAVCALGSVPRERIVCIPWGIDLQRFRPKAPTLGLRERLGWHGSRTIISARSFEPFHGTMMFLEAMKQVLQRCADARVLVLGDGSLKARVEDFIEGHGLEDKIHVAGRVSEETLADYFAEADLYVSTTLCDGSSVSMLEAMGCGLAVLVPDVGGNQEWVTHGRNGWLYPVGDADALVLAAIQALDNDVARREMGLANVRIVRERADWHRNFSKLLAAQNHLLAVNSSRGIPSHAHLQDR